MPPFYGRRGLSQRPRRKPGLYTAPVRTLTVPTRPNHVWTVDFKGWFNLGDGQRCDPLTVCDLYSRYYLACRAILKGSNPDCWDLCAG